MENNGISIRIVHEVRTKKVAIARYLSIRSSLFPLLYGGPCCLRLGRPWNSGAPKSRSSLSMMSSMLTSVSWGIVIGFRGRLECEPEKKKKQQLLPFHMVK